jgi:5-formyltetrahydrofolate cyclo-ligase
MVMLTKQQIRYKILLRLKTQKEEDRNRKSKEIERKLLRTKVFKNAKTVMFYIAFGVEVDTEGMITAARKLGKRIAVPVLIKDGVTLRPCILEEDARLTRGHYGIWEPAMKRFIDAEHLGLVLVPGVAFDKKGNRLGRGKGCYDRFLKKLKPNSVSIGLAFDFQILPSVPSKAHDVSVSRVLYA